MNGFRQNLPFLQVVPTAANGMGKVAHVMRDSIILPYNFFIYPYPTIMPSAISIWAKHKDLTLVDIFPAFKIFIAELLPQQYVNVVII